MKKTLALLLTFAMLLPMVTVFASLGASGASDAIYDKPSHTAANDGSVGFTVDDSDGDSSADDFYFTRKKLERIPVTYQAWVYIPADYSSRLVSSRGDLGVIVSNRNYVNDTHGAQFDVYITKERTCKPFFQN